MNQCVQYFKISPCSYINTATLTVGYYALPEVDMFVLTYATGGNGEQMPSQSKILLLFQMHHSLQISTI